MKSFNHLPEYMQVYFEMDVVHFSLPRIRGKAPVSARGNEENPGGLLPPLTPGGQVS